MHSLACVGAISGCGDCRRADQGPETFTQTRACHVTEATGTDFSTQTAIRGRVMRDCGWPSPATRKRSIPNPRTHQKLAKARPSSSDRRNRTAPFKKSLKKVLTPEDEIQYHGARFQNRQGLLPGRFFVCSDLIHAQKNNQNTTGKEKEHIHVFIESS